MRRGEKVTVDVAVHLSGEAAPGTLVLVDLNTVAIEVDALAIPESITVDITGAAPGTQVLAGELPLPSGAVLVTDPEAMVVAVSAAEAAEMGEESAESGEATDAAESSEEG